MKTPEDKTVREAQSREQYDPTAKQKAAAKLSRIPVKVEQGEVLKKPDWIRVKAGSPSTRFYEIKDILRSNKLVTVCEEASCPNIGECFGKGTATFMIMGDKCTRRCPFCDVGHGRPDPLDVNEPDNLAKTIAALKLKYVVITSVDRDDLRDGGAQHFVECIRAVRATSPSTTIEVLVPDFRGRLDRALDILRAAPPDVMNHNLETIPRLYRQARPGIDAQQEQLACLIGRERKAQSLFAHPALELARAVDLKPGCCRCCVVGGGNVFCHDDCRSCCEEVDRPSNPARPGTGARALARCRRQGSVSDGGQGL